MQHLDRLWIVLVQQYVFGNFQFQKSSGKTCMDEHSFYVLRQSRMKLCGEKIDADAKAMAGRMPSLPILARGSEHPCPYGGRQIT